MSTQTNFAVANIVENLQTGETSFTHNKFNLKQAKEKLTLQLKQNVFETNSENIEYPYSSFQDFLDTQLKIGKMRIIGLPGIDIFTIVDINLYVNLMLVSLYNEIKDKMQIISTSFRKTDMYLDCSIRGIKWEKNVNPCNNPYRHFHIFCKYE